MCVRIYFAATATRRFIVESLYRHGTESLLELGQVGKGRQPLHEDVRRLPESIYLSSLTDRFVPLLV